MKVSWLSVILVLALTLAIAPSRVSAETPFPQNGSTLTYSVFMTAKSSQGNITATSTDSYSFQQIGNEWNVTETVIGKISCHPPTADLSVRYRTISDIFGVNSSVSSDPNILIKVSYMVQNRTIVSTPIGPNVAAGYFAKCSLGGKDIASVGQATPALYVSPFIRYYVMFHIQTAGVGVGTLVPVGILPSTITAIESVAVMNTSRPALVGTITGIISGRIYWDQESGILLLEESTNGIQSERMLLSYSTVPIPEFRLSQVALGVATSVVLLFALAGNRKRSSRLLDKDHLCLCSLLPQRSHKRASGRPFVPH